MKLWQFLQARSLRLEKATSDDAPGIERQITAALEDGIDHLAYRVLLDALTVELAQRLHASGTTIMEPLLRLQLYSIEHHALGQIASGEQFQFR